MSGLSGESLSAIRASATMANMERQALNLFAAWTNLQSLMKDYTLIALEGEDAQAYADKGRYADDYILKEYKKVVRRVWGVAFPQVFSVIYKEAKAVRDKLAHMTAIASPSVDTAIIPTRRPNRLTGIQTKTSGITTSRSTMKTTTDGSRLVRRCAA